MGPGPLRFRMLGNVTATREDVPLDLGGRRQRAVLALLLLARGQVVSADQLADCLWGEDPPANSAGALQAHISHLRRGLEPEGGRRARGTTLVSERRGYALRLPPGAVDAWEFEALVQEAAASPSPAGATRILERALGLWGGPPLAEYADQAWAQAPAARLTELHALAREQLLAARLGRGENALLVPELEVLVAEEPLREERWRLLVLALYRAQRQADALAALRRARMTLAEELGADPGPALRQLEAQVLDQSPALEAPPPLVGPAPAQPAANTAVAPDLVERGRELSTLRKALDDLASGQPRLLVVEGAAGIGKSRLLAELRTSARARGLTVLFARGSQMEQSFGFGVVRQLFEPVLVDPDRRSHLLSGSASSACGVFDAACGEERAEGSFAALHGLFWLTVNFVAAGPVLIAVDDLQWCDTASLRYLGYLARRLEGLDVLVVATRRTGEQGDGEDLVAELVMDATTVRPGPLSTDATAELVGQQLGEASASFVAACHRVTSGNPLLLRQLLQALQGDRVRADDAHVDRVLAVGSRAMSNVVTMRLRRAPGEVVTVARAVAVLDGAAQLPAVASLAELPEDRTAAALADLVRLELLRDESAIAFTHPLIRDAVYRAVPAAERGLRHERAVWVLRGLGASAEQLAAHLLLCPCRGDPATVSLLREAARTAAERGASDSAVTLLRRALAEPPTAGARTDVLQALGSAEALVDGPSSIAHLLAAYALVQEPQRRGELALAITRSHVHASPPGVAAQFAREAMAALPAELGDIRQGLLGLERISGLMQALDPATWRSPDVPEPSGSGAGARMLRAALSFEAMVEGRDRARAIELARAATEDDDTPQAGDSGLTWEVAAIAREVADDELGDFWNRARSRAHQRGSLFDAMSTNCWQGFWHWRRGELDEALTCLCAAEEQDRLWGGSGVALSYTRASLIGVHLDRGDPPAAREVASEIAGAPFIGEGRRHVQQAIARLLIAECSFQEALALLATVQDPVGIANPAWNPWRSLRAMALHGLGRTPEAVELMSAEVDLLRRWGGPTLLGNGLRLLGELTGGAGLQHLREAVGVLEPTSAVLLLARARCALGSSPDVPDDEAVPLLLAAARVAHRCGARELCDTIAARLALRGHSWALADSDRVRIRDSSGSSGSSREASA